MIETAIVHEIQEAVTCSVCKKRGGLIKKMPGPPDARKPFFIVGFIPAWVLQNGKWYCCNRCYDKGSFQRLITINQKGIRRYRRILDDMAKRMKVGEVPEDAELVTKLRELIEQSVAEIEGYRKRIAELSH